MEAAPVEQVAALAQGVEPPHALPVLSAAHPVPSVEPVEIFAETTQDSPWQPERVIEVAPAAHVIEVKPEAPLTDFEPAAAVALTSAAEAEAEAIIPAEDQELAPPEVLVTSFVLSPIEQHLESATLSVPTQVDMPHDGASSVQMWLTGADERIQEQAPQVPLDTALVDPIINPDEDKHEASRHPQDKPHPDKPRQDLPHQDLPS